MRKSDEKLIVNVTLGTIVCERGAIADCPLARMRGLLGRSELPAGEGILLLPAPMIHTAFMRFAIDAVFLDAELRIVKLEPGMAPWHTAGASGARAVLELAEGEIERRALAVGHRLATRDYLVRPIVSVPVQRSGRLAIAA